VITTPSNIPKHSPYGDTCLHADRSKHRCIRAVPVTIATASAAGQAAPAVAPATKLLQLSTTEALCLQHRKSTVANSTATSATS